MTEILAARLTNALAKKLRDLAAAPGRYARGARVPGESPLPVTTSEPTTATWAG